ncbi:hypothetical protein QAD02_007745 [Eretmocerus hayati]|uniref:Uncharacterized protein n=1 Tax=Eretmocerus hayati TaxID=131215 RepID=A0ACC2N4K1_9HYME|nr:hypothetical protein QAD02_007745 [Eretmocerus hayati]
MYGLLSDNDTYVPVNSNPLGSLQKNVKELLYKWNEQGYLGRVYHRFALTQTDTALSEIYGLPKIHKEGVSLRPIVSAVNSPTYFLSKTVDKILKACLSKAESYIRNSQDSISQVMKIKVPKDHIGFSSDIKALFLSTPLDLTVQAVEKRHTAISRFMPFMPNIRKSMYTHRRQRQRTGRRGIKTLEELCDYLTTEEGKSYLLREDPFGVMPNVKFDCRKIGSGKEPM